MSCLSRSQPSWPSCWPPRPQVTLPSRDYERHGIQDDVFGQRASSKDQCVRGKSDCVTKVVLVLSRTLKVQTSELNRGKNAVIVVAVSGQVTQMSRSSEPFSLREQSTTATAIRPLFIVNTNESSWNRERGLSSLYTKKPRRFPARSGVCMG